MNGCDREFSSRVKGVLLLAGACAALAAVASADPVRAAEGYPSFASVPPAPKDVRPLSAWRTAVIQTRVVGARLARQASKEPWTLSDTAGFAARERNEATPPPPITTPTEPETAALVAAMKARASQPPRSH